MSRSTRCAALCLAVGALSGCDEDALRLPPPASSAHPTGSAVPVASATASPEPSGNASFAVVARSPDAFELYPLKGALFVDAAGFLAVLGDGPLRQSPALMKGLEKGASGRVLGAWPEGAWLVAGERTHRWAGDRWVEEKLLHEHEALLAVTAWDDERVLAAISLPGNDMRFSLASGKPGATLPVPSAAGAHNAGAQPGEGAETDEKEVPCKVRLKPRGVALAGLPSGELYAVGYECEPLGHGGPIVERWEPKQPHGTVEALPRPESGQQPAPRGLLARSAGEVLVYGGEGVPAAPYLARFDGKAWSVEHAPFGAGIDTLGAADDGTLWAAAGGSVWKKAGAAAWEKVELPPGLATQAVWPRGGDVWVAARQTEGKGRAVLLRTAREPRPEMIRVPPRNAMAGSLASHQRFFATAACDRVYVELGTLGPSKDPTTGKPAAVPKRFPTLDAVPAGETTRAPAQSLLGGELAALVPVVEDDGAYFHLGVQVPSREIGRKLMGAYQEKNPGATPVQFCHEAIPAGETPKAPAPPGARRPNKDR